MTTTKGTCGCLSITLERSVEERVAMMHKLEARYGKAAHLAIKMLYWTFGLSLADANLAALSITDKEVEECQVGS